MNVNDWNLLRPLGPTIAAYEVKGVYVLVLRQQVVGIYPTLLDLNRAALLAHAREVDWNNRHLLFH